MLIKADDGARTAVAPEDLIAARAAAPKAKAFFSTLNASNRYAVLRRIQTAVKEETRSARHRWPLGLCSRAMGPGAFPIQIRLNFLHPLPKIDSGS